MISNNYKILFIIDDLDDIKDNEMIMTIISSIQKLFNINSVFFIFITGEEFNNFIDEKKVYHKEYTLLSKKIFIRRARVREIEAFIDSIVHDFKNASEDDYHAFRNYACYASRMQYFPI